MPLVFGPIHKVLLPPVYGGGAGGGGANAQRGCIALGRPAPMSWAPTRLATSVCQLRDDRLEQGPTEPHAGRSTFLLSSGGAEGGYY